MRKSIKKSTVMIFVLILSLQAFTPMLVLARMLWILKPEAEEVTEYSCAEPAYASLLNVLPKP